MLFIAFLFFFLLYLAVSIWLSMWIAKKASKHGYSGKKWGVAVFVLMLGLIFWDWLPMEILYRNKCENHAGFFLDKTIDEWKAENPGVWETLSPEALPEAYFVKEKHGQERSKRRFYQLPDGTELIANYDIVGKYLSTDMISGDGLHRYWINQRFYWETIWTRHLFQVRELEDRIVDMETGEVIARYVDFRTSIPSFAVGASDLSGYKFWMYKDSCESDRRSKGLFSEFHHFVRFKEEIKL